MLYSLGLEDISLSHAEEIWLTLACGGILLAILGWVDRRAKFARIALSGLVICCLARYVGWRLTETIPAVGLTWETAWQWAFLTFEIPSLGGLLVVWVYMTRTIDRSAEATRHANWYGDAPPLVDLFIATYNEEEEILERTIFGALNMDYSNFRVWVLDDGRRKWVRELAESAGAYYLTRSDNRHAKAGNLNNGLRHVLSLPETPEYIAILDADFVSTQPFLTRAMALFHDPTIGAVQTPQHFFNPDPLQMNLMGQGVLPDDQRFINCNELEWRDAWGLATSVGTSSVWRVDGLLRIGGFPSEAVTEDTLSSLKFWTIGYKTAFLNEPLTQGLAVESIREFLVQRSRWSLGNMQILRSEWGLFSGRYANPGPYVFFYQLLLGSIITPIYFWMLLLAPLIFLFTGVLAVDTDILTLGAYLLPLLVVSAVGMAWVSGGAQIWFVSDANRLVEHFASLPAGFQGLLFPNGQQFKVTAKGETSDGVTVQWSLLRWLLPFIALTLVGIAYNITAPYAMLETPQSVVLATAWGVYNFVILSIAIMMCMDLPRRGDELCLNIREIGTVKGGQIDGIFQIEKMSLKEAHLTGVAPTPIGAQVRLGWRGVVNIPAYVSANCNGSTRLSLVPGPRLKQALARELFSGRFMNSVVRADVLACYWAILRRLLHRSSLGRKQG